MNNRERFLIEMRENIPLPYEAPQPLWEDKVGEFENPVESAYFQRFISLTGPGAEVLDLACGDGRHTLRLAAPNVTFMEGSMLAPSFPPAALDGVWFSQAFEYVPPDLRDAFLSTLHTILKPTGVLYLSAETWARPRRWDALKALWHEARLYCYWKYVRGKPLLWGEFLYRLPAWETPSRGWHYHVHTSPRTLRVLLDRHDFVPQQIDVSDGYIYVLCSRRESISRVKGLGMSEPHS